MMEVGAGEWMNYVIPVFLTAIVCGWIFVWYKVWERYGKEHPAENVQSYVKSPPLKLPPAIVESLLSQGQSVTVSAFSATILDLARRNIIGIEARQVHRPDLLGLRNILSYSYILHLADREVLEGVSFLGYEALLINFLFSQADDRKTIPVENIKKMIDDDSFVTGKVFRDWIKQVKKEAEGYDFLEPESRGWRMIFLVSNVFFVVFLFIVCVIYVGMRESFDIFSAVYSLGPVAAVISGNLFLRWNKNTKGEVMKWQGFKRYLEDFNYLENEIPHAVTIWEDMLVYGTALGITKTVTDFLPAVFNQKAGALPSWYYFSAADGSAVGIEDLKGQGIDAGKCLAESFLNMSTSFAFSFSSESGGGFPLK